MTRERRNWRRSNGEAREATHSRAAEMSDAWLLDLVDDPETARALSDLVVADAVAKKAMTQEEAERAFLPVPPEPAIEVEDLMRMTSDILAGKTRPHIDTRAGWDAWRSLERDVEEIKRRGGVVDFPAL